MYINFSSHTNEYLKETREEEGSATGSTGGVVKSTHKLNERERKQAALPILIFGYQLVSILYMDLVTQVVSEGAHTLSD